RPAFIFAPDQAPLGAPQSSEAIQYHRSDVEAGPLQPRTSLLRQHLEAGSPDDAVKAPPVVQHPDGEPGASRAGEGGGAARQTAFRERERKALEAELAGSFLPASHSSRQSIFAIPPHLASPLIGSYGSYGSYGTIRSDVSRASMLQA